MNLLAKILNLFGPSRVIHFGELPPYEVVATVDDPDTLVPVELTVVSPEQFDRAYEEYVRPVIGESIEGRWISVLPDVDRSKYPAPKAQCDDVRWTAARWAEDIRCGRIAGNPDEVLKRMIATKYPFLTNLGHIRTHNFAWFATR
ncbi:MAG TPA: hypothetical protein VGM96_18550 [Reyranella sp.]|jgi:hypothetical protein